MKVLLVTCLILFTHSTYSLPNEGNDEDEVSADKQDLLKSLEEMEKNLPTMDYNDKEAFESYIVKLIERAELNDTFHKVPDVKYINRTVDDDLYNAVHNVRIKPDAACYPPGFKFVNYSGYVAPKKNKKEHIVNEEDLLELDDLMKEDKRKKRSVANEAIKNKEEQTNQILRDIIVDDEYHQQMNELKNKIKDKVHIKNYLYINFENKDWYKRYKRDLNEAFDELSQNVNKNDLFSRDNIRNTIKQAKHHHRGKRDLGDYEKEKDDFTKQLANFEINQANIKGLINKGIGLNMLKAMKLSIDYSLKAYVNTSSSLDESVQRFFILKQEYMNLIDKWYHGVVIDLPNYLKSQERKKINLSFDDDQPTPQEREQLNKLNEYERVVDKEFAEVGIHYGKTLLNNYCDMDDLFYKYHRENNQCDIQVVFSEANTKELLKKENIVV